MIFVVVNLGGLDFFGIVDGLKGMKTISSKVEVERIHSPRNVTGPNDFFLTDFRSRKIQAVNPKTEGPLNPGALLMPEISS